MIEHDVAYACLCETKLFGEDISTDKWKWLAGQRRFPAFRTTRRRREWAWVSWFPDAEVVHTGKYTVWVRLPGRTMDMYVCACYAPVYPSQKRDAIAEVVTSYLQFWNKGFVTIGGDFNVRCGHNGDMVVNADGAHLQEVCANHGLNIVNSMEDICEGEFTWEQDV